MRYRSYRTPASVSRRVLHATGHRTYGSGWLVNRLARWWR